jgi:hypothetical protein
MTTPRLQFDGWIAGIGTASGVRIVIGHWPSSPFGPVSDVMIESPGGHRLLLASTTRLATFVATTYRFDQVRVAPVGVVRDGVSWTVQAESLALRLTVGRRPPLGWALRAVPPGLAGRPGWVGLLDVPARTLLPGVRTRGSAGSGRREWYGARDLCRITAATTQWAGRDLGGLADVTPPVRFGFGSVPRVPAVVRVTTTIEVSPRDRLLGTYSGC